LLLLQYGYPSSAGVVDFLCTDSGGCMAIIEVRLQGDYDILFQALGHFSAIDKDRHLIAPVLKDRRVNPEGLPRAARVAEEFFEDLGRLGIPVASDVKFFEYSPSCSQIDKEIPYSIRFLCQFHCHPLQDPRALRRSSPAQRRRTLSPFLVRRGADLCRSARESKKAPRQATLATSTQVRFVGGSGLAGAPA
jgi:hypothetical protein